MPVSHRRAPARYPALILLVVFALVFKVRANDPAPADKPYLALCGKPVVNIGDSITDGQTYSLLVEQALREAKILPPRFIGAGIGGDTAAGMLARLNRDVFVYHPAAVMLSCGINDVASGISMGDFEKSVTAIAERMKREHVRLYILTTTNLGPEHADIEPKLVEANAVLHRVAAKYDCPVAEVYECMQAARKAGPGFWMDGVHLNLAGYRHMSRAVLDALGGGEIPIPTELHPLLLPGVIKQWQVLALPEVRPPLEEKDLAALASHGTWKPLALPEKTRGDNFWFDQERQRGVAISLRENFGPAKSFIAIAELDSPEEREACLNLGGELRTAWLNGKRVFGPGDPPRGWHPGAYRIAVHLNKGINQIIVETDAHFFASITDNGDW
jgi:lysophospholipase L1-like esterase